MPEPVIYHWFHIHINVIVSFEVILKALNIVYLVFAQVIKQFHVLVTDIQ